MLRTLKILVVFLLFAVAGRAQQIRVEAVLDTGKIRIGEQARVDLYFTYNASLGDLKVQWPSIQDTLASKIEVIETTAIDTTFPNKTNSTLIHQHQQIVISCFDSGFYVIPPFKFTVNGADSMYTLPLTLEVHTMPVDTAAGKFKDIKPPFNEAFNWKWYLPTVYAGLGILALLLILIWWYRKINRQTIDQPAEEEKPKVPAHITALEHLTRIREQAIWKEGKVKQYYSEITDVLRAYIEGRFEMNALESTSDEIMTAFRSIVVDAQSKDKLRQVLSLADLVKFAKMTPIESEHEMSLQNAFDFVNGTKREEVVNLDTNNDTSGE